MAAVEAGADYIGLVFAPSPRQVSPTEAKRIASIVKASRRTIQLVGVFVNMPVFEINQIVDFCGLDWVQLSGDESWECCHQITKPIIKGVRIKSSQQQSAEDILVILSVAAQGLSPRRFVFLLDSEINGKYGGTGATFDWGLTRLVTRRFPVIIAGGLTPQNVGRVIEEVAPWGVDVSSGVEVGGVKDISKIKAFIEAVRKADEKRRHAVT